MYVYLIVLLSFALVSSLARATGQRPETPNWYHAVDAVLIGIALVWVVSSVVR